MRTNACRRPIIRPCLSASVWLSAAVIAVIVLHGSVAQASEPDPTPTETPTPTPTPTPPQGFECDGNYDMKEICPGLSQGDDSFVAWLCYKGDDFCPPVTVATIVPDSDPVRYALNSSLFSHGTGGSTFYDAYIGDVDVKGQSGLTLYTAGEYEVEVTYMIPCDNFTGGPPYTPYKLKVDVQVKEFNRDEENGARRVFTRDEPENGNGENGNGENGNEEDPEKVSLFFHYQQDTTGGQNEYTFIPDPPPPMGTEITREGRIGVKYVPHTDDRCTADAKGEYKVEIEIEAWVYAYAINSWFWPHNSAFSEARARFSFAHDGPSEIWIVADTDASEQLSGITIGFGGVTMPLMESDAVIDQQADGTLITWTIDKHIQESPGTKRHQGQSHVYDGTYTLRGKARASVENQAEATAILDIKVRNKNPDVKWQATALP